MQSRICLFLFFIFLSLLGWFIAVSIRRRFQFFKLCGGIRMYVFIPHDHIIELSLRYEHLIKSFERLRLLVHHSKHPHPVTFDLLNRIAIQCQVLQVLKSL